MVGFRSAEDQNVVLAFASYEARGHFLAKPEQETKDRQEKKNHTNTGVLGTFKLQINF